MRYDDQSSASLEEYIEWIAHERLYLTDKEYKSYTRLIFFLTGIEFEWVVPRDENRAADGLALREDFTYETGLFLDSSTNLMPRCTFFEMLAALAYRCESQIMLDFSNGYNVSRWFFIMLENLGLKDLTNSKFRRDDENYIMQRVNNFMDREYKKDGTGGIFVVKNRKIDMTEEEIWKQCMAFLNENYL